MCLEKAGPLPAPIVFKELEFGLPVPETPDQLIQMQMSEIYRPTPTEPKVSIVILAEEDFPVPKPLDQLMRAGVSAVSGPIPMEPETISVSLAKGDLPAP
ncbi:MAG: hypothetical protein QG610_2072 [Euryarchaeota archaeon]|nr:hypothetical protein [Euryarchaeota archaeon]